MGKQGGFLFFIYRVNPVVHGLHRSVARADRYLQGVVYQALGQLADIGRKSC